MASYSVKMKAMKGPIKTVGIYMIGALLCFVAAFLDNIYVFLGRTVNYFFPCMSNAASSAPCYIGYDIYFIVSLSLLGWLLIGIAITKSIAYRKKNKKTPHK
ncbi:MAG: hypothetical protein PHG66_02235 [Candidatus Colwellbacteria bacterium]|nr:hypothetical protein [Candidatus Colwellbacteria bacterium]